MALTAICRLCGTGEGIKFKIFDPGRDYISKIHQFLPIMIHEQDPWPKLICHRCVFKLQEFNDFREHCIKIDKYLKSQKPWEREHERAATSTWTDTNAPIKIKEETKEEPPSPQKPVIRSPPAPTQMMLQQHPIMQQSYQSPVQAQLIPQQQYMSVLTHSPHLMIQRQSSSQQAPQMPLPMVQFHQKAVNMDESKHFVSCSSENTQSPTNAVFLNSGEGECFLPEGTEPDCTDSDRDLDSECMSDSGSNQKAPETQKNKNTGGTKKRRYQTDPSYRSRKRSRTKSRPQNKSQSNPKPKVDVNNVKSQIHNDVAQATPKSKRGRKSKNVDNSHSKNSSQSRESLQTQDKSRNAEVWKKLETNFPKKVDNPGSRLRTGNRETNISFVHHKSTDSVLNTVEPDSPRDDDLPPHMLVTKIPGICNIFTCTFCECTVTSKKRVFEHVCSKKKVADDNIKSSEVNVETGAYKCDICNISFARHVTLTAHRDSHLYLLSDSDSDDSIHVMRENKKLLPETG